MSKTVGAILFGLIGTAVLIGLGIWQVQRLAWKEDILASIDARVGAPPVAIPATPDPAEDLYLPVTITGRLTGEEVHVLVSTRQRGAGYRVIRVLETADRKVLIDLGYLALTAKDDPRAAGEVTVTGNLHWPDEIDSYTPQNDTAKNIWFSRDVPTLAAALGSEPVFVVARTLSPELPGISPLPLDTSAIPNDHLQYAITWFSLAVIWVGMTGVFVYRQRRDLAE